DAPMTSRITCRSPRSLWRGALVAVAALALPAPRVPAQDGDEDGVLPHHGSSSGSSEDVHAPGVVGLTGEQLGLDQLSATRANLVFTAVGGSTILETSVG